MWIAILICFIFSVFMALAILHCVGGHDDAIAAAGTALTDAFFKNNDGEPDTIMGMRPVLRDIILADIDVHSDLVPGLAKVTLQPNTWPNTKRITHLCDVIGGTFATEAATAPLGTNVPGILDVKGRYNIPIEDDLTWVDGTNGKAYATEDNADIALILAYSYGKAFPYSGVNRIHWVEKVADAAEATADAYDEAWATSLKGVAPGLDGKKKYILRGIWHRAAAAAKLGCLVRGGVQDNPFKIIGPGTGTLGRLATLFHFDGIPVSGDDGYIAETLGGAADTPYAALGFEDLSGPGNFKAKKVAGSRSIARQVDSMMRAGGVGR